MQPLPPEEARRDGAEDAQWSRPECQAWTGTLLLGTCLLYCARVSMPVCTVSMSQDFGWNKKEAGIVLSSFFWGYCLTQVVGGHLGDRIGGEKVIVLSASAWGFITAATPLLAHLSSAHLVFMTFSRILTGLLQGVYFPALTSLLSQKVRESERAFTYSAVGAGSQFGLQDHRCAEVHAGDGPRAVQRFCPVFGPHLELLQVCGLCISVHWPADLQPQRHFSQHPGPGPILCRLSVWCGQHSWGLGRCRGRVPGRLPHRDHRLLDIHVQPGGCRQQPGAVHLPAVWRGPASGPEPHPRGPLAAPADRSFSAVCLGVMGSVGEPPTPDSRCVNRGRASPSRAGQPWVGLSFSSEVIVPSPQGSWTVRGEWS
ncbi:solute carrier family 17 member 9 isoform X13 [Ursus arctos]|uniref:solute carrier family 17 member 9 isoform X13 n=1 Tax=Ursus arctos TaxID=9644 RepID=UPI002548FB92|nr:solute carrier family 17 member 9 isoform X13 [Ursus arctos]